MSPNTKYKGPLTSIFGTALKRLLPRRNAAFGAVLIALASTSAFAGGGDVSTDEVYSDGIILTDIDGDGNVDLAVAANRSFAAGRSRYYLGNGDGTFGSRILLIDGASSEIAVADVTGDTFLDLIQGRRDLTDLVIPGDSFGDLIIGSATDVSADTNRVLDLAIGDLDNDGDLDIVMGNGRPGGVVSVDPQPNRFYLNGGTGTFTGADIAADADDSRGIALADMDGDGDLDVIVGNDDTTPGSNRIYMNQFVESGSTAVSFAAGIDFGPADDQTSRIVIGDLNNDTLPDIVAINTVQAGTSPGINRFFLNETAGGIFALSTEMDVSADADRSNSGVLADFDGDGDLDLAVANGLPTAGESARPRLYLNQFIGSGTVSFAAGIDISIDEQMSRSIAAADLNGDTFIDIVVGNQDLIDGVSGRDRRYLNNGTADPFANVVPVIDTQAGALATDEETDLLIELDDVTVTDGDNVFPDDFTLTVQEGDNYTVTSNTITPVLGFAGDLTVPVVVNDGTDDSGSFDLTVTVNDTVNNPPTFTSTPLEVAREGEVYTYNITTDDPDVGEVAAISELATLPGWLTLTDNNDGTATLTGTPGAADVGAANTVSLQASDGVDTATQTFDITINAPPEFTSSPVTSATEGTMYMYAITASDADVGDTLAITSAGALPGWLNLTDNGDGTADLVGTPDAADVGDHAISLQVSDGTETAVQDFTIVVSADPTPPANNAPTITSTAITDATEGTTYTYDITTSDDDAGDTLEISAPTLPAWLTLNDNGDGTAALTGTPAAADVGDHDISLQVSDGTDTATQNFTITVEAGVAPPPPPPPPSGGGGGGGSLGFLSLLALGAVGAARRRRSR
jgi:MYXO-CTERM domain-containing protein